MEYLFFILAMAAFVLVIFVSESVRTKREEKRFIDTLYHDYGKLSEKEYALERFARMGSFFDRHQRKGQLDDITWNDLGMDELFKRMNYTLSASGEEYLYYTLRTLKQEEGELARLEEAVRFFGEHPETRVRVQLAANRLGHTGKFSLYDYLDNLDLLGERSSRKHLLMDLLFLPLIGLLWVNFSLAILGIVGLIIYNILSYFKEKGEIDPYIASFSYIMRLMRCCEELGKLDLPVCWEEWARMRQARKQMQGMARNSYWVISPFRGNSSGDILALVLDYVRMVFHADLIKFDSMLNTVRGHIGDVDAMIETVGYVETVIAIWIFRESLGEEGADGNRGWCTPDFPAEGGLSLEEGYHPMLKAPVKNGIAARKGVLLTGSNASGKSTFLKMVALNAILAQTIHTCAADSYRAPFYHVYSSMALRDDMESGESYYIVEIKALKRILDAAAGDVPILCFVDEVLRGTNTIERIAASTQILKSLGRTGILCFAATHDIELTELLQDDFDNYHFEEDVAEGDVVFNYRLKEGKATTRNAIKLLELMGYDRDVIERATAQAEHFAESGVWQNVID
jgi:energy-coupling factor transporter ATP-binding protein EcfA2